MNQRVPALICAMILLLPLCAQSDTLRPHRGGGRGDGSGGGRGDGSGGGRAGRMTVVEKDTVERSIRKDHVRPERYKPRGRVLFSGVFVDPTLDTLPTDARQGRELPEALVRAFVSAQEPEERMRRAGTLVDSALAYGTSAVQYAWGDSLLRFATARKDSALMARAHLARGTALIREGRNGRAFDELRTAYALCDERTEPVMVAMINSRIGDGLMAMGGSTGALQRYDEVLRLAGKAPIPQDMLAHVLDMKAGIQAEQGWPDSAEVLYQHAVTAARNARLPDVAARSLMGLGRVAIMRNEVQLAFQRYEEAIAEVEGTPFISLVLEARLALGMALLEHDRPGEARTEFRTAMHLADSLGSVVQGAKSRLLLAEAAGGDDREALRLLHEASIMVRDPRMAAYRREVMLSQVWRYQRVGREKEALTRAIDALRLTDSLNHAFWETGMKRQLRRSQLGLKDREIADLEHQRAVQNEAAVVQRDRIVFQRNLIIASIGAAIVILVLAFAAFKAYRAERRAAAQLAQAHAEVLRQKERAEEGERTKARFLANVSHEIRTPLNAIIGFTDLMLGDRHDARTSHFLGSVRDAGENLLVLINDVLDLSRMEAGRLTLLREPFDLHLAVHRSIELLRHRAQAQRDDLGFELATDVPRWVLGDGARLSQMLLNLIGNALKFTTDGSVLLKVGMDAANVRFQVIDTGIGIAQDKLESIFERFTQAHPGDQHRYGGTGLGLSIVKELLALHQGHIEVTSTPGKGSTFTLWIPYEPTEAPVRQHSAVPPAPAEHSLQDRTILVAEDNPLNAQVVRATLERYYPHVQVVVVNNGREAMDAVRADIDQDIALVLMDVQMPVLDGLSATRAIRAEEGTRSHLPIIGLTASVLPGDLSLCIDAGMDACVPKPFRARQLVDAIAGSTGDPGVQAGLESGDQDLLEERALFAELVPERLARLRIARDDGNHSEMQRLVHFMRFQLVRHDEVRYAVRVERLLRTTAGPDFDKDVDALIADLESELT